MKKAVYFPLHTTHYSSVKSLTIRMKYDFAGYALYLMLWQKLAETTDRKLPLKKIPELAFDFRCDKQTLSDIINDGFSIIDGNFYSQELNESLLYYDAIREKASEGGKKAAENLTDEERTERARKAGKTSAEKRAAKAQERRDEALKKEIEEQVLTENYDEDLSKVKLEVKEDKKDIELSSKLNELTPLVKSTNDQLTPLVHSTNNRNINRNRDKIEIEKEIETKIEIEKEIEIEIENKPEQKEKIDNGILEIEKEDLTTSKKDLDLNTSIFFNKSNEIKVRNFYNQFVISKYQIKINYPKFEKILVSIIYLYFPNEITDNTKLNQWVNENEIYIDKDKFITFLDGIKNNSNLINKLNSIFQLLSFKHTPIQIPL